MSTLKEATEDTTDRQESKKLAHLKCYSFFLFYSQSIIHSPLHVFHSHLESQLQNKGLHFIWKQKSWTLEAGSDKFLQPWVWVTTDVRPYEP